MGITTKDAIPIGFIYRYFPETGLKNCWTVVERGGVPQNGVDLPCGGNLNVDAKQLLRLEELFRGMIKEIR